MHCIKYTCICNEKEYFFTIFSNFLRKKEKYGGVQTI